jgi:hypothetical protein
MSIEDHKEIPHEDDLAKKGMGAHKKEETPHWRILGDPTIPLIVET